MCILGFGVNKYMRNHWFFLPFCLFCAILARARFPVNRETNPSRAPYVRTCPNLSATQYQTSNPSNATKVATNGKIDDENKLGMGVSSWESCVVHGVTKNRKVQQL